MTDETDPEVTTDEEETVEETDEEKTDEENKDGSAEETEEPKEETEPDDGLVHDLSYYVQKIAKHLEETVADPEEDKFESESDDDVEVEQPIDGDTLRSKHMRSLQSTVKKSVAFHEHRLRLCKTICSAAHKYFVNTDSISDFKYLRCVDFGKNYIRDLSSFSDLPFLGTLKLYKNGMNDVATLKSRSLRYLDVAENKVKNLDGTVIPRVARLNMSFNRIRSLDFLKEQEVKWLRRLELRGNRLTTTAGIRHQFLEELYLAENDIREVEDLEFCPNLKRLHLRDNQIIEVTGFSKRSTKLEYVNLRNNLITFIDDAVGICVLPKLKNLIMLDNPVQLEEDFRMVLLARMPSLLSLDNVPVLPYDRDWNIMLLLDCLHHEEADLMVAVGDLMEKLQNVDKEDAFTKEARKSLRSSAGANQKEKRLDSMPDTPDGDSEVENDLDREYWGENGPGADDEAGQEGEEEEET